MMEPLVNGQPGEHESWEELAEHSLLRDDVDRAGWSLGPLTFSRVPRTPGQVRPYLERTARRTAAARDRAAARAAL